MNPIPLYLNAHHMHSITHSMMAIGDLSGVHVLIYEI